ncbi:hypothetical protein FI667_g1492, partial [Globisporangium splendens]
MIKEDAEYRFPAHHLTLYVAKKRGKWLKADNLDVVLLEQGEVSNGIKVLLADEQNKMDPLDRATDVATDFPDQYVGSEDDYHVLIEVSAHLKRATDRLRCYDGS